MRTALAVGLAAAVIGLTAGLLDRGPGAPPDRAADLVPADAMAYVHLAGDRRQALFDRIGRLPGADRVLGSVTGFDGDEVAIALLDTGTSTANTLILVSAENEKAVRKRFPEAATVDGFVAIGQKEAVQAAKDLAAGRGKPLSAQSAYVRAAADRPDGRALDVWLSPEGVRRVLRPQAGLVGALGGLLETPALEGVSVSMVPEERGLRVVARQLRSRNPARPPEFEPTLVDRVPKDAAGYIGLADLEAIVGALPAGPASLVAQLPAISDLIASLRGEVAISITPELPQPVFTLTARVPDVGRTRAALGTLQEQLGDLLAGSEDSTGQVPTFEERDLGGGVQAFGLRLGAGVELLYAIVGDRLVISNSEAGVKRATASGGASLADGERFGDALSDLPDKVEALAFLDLGQLLALADAAGFGANPGYQSARDGLREISAIGAVAERQGTDTTAELFFQIP